MPSLKKGFLDNMSDLAPETVQLAQRAAQESKALRTLINSNVATLGALTTTAKESLVAAINEVKAGAGVTTLTTPPSNTSVIWFDPSDCTLSVYNGFYWVTDGTIYNIPDGDTPDNAITFNGDILTFNGDTLTFAA
jgi:hypothetical protein